MSLKTNPSDGVTPPKAEAPKLITPTPAQIGELLRCAEESFRAPLTLLAATGARRGEIAALKWSDLDLDGEHPFLRIVGTLQRVDGRLVVLAPKTERARRTVPLPASVVPMLRRVRTEQAERRLLCGPAWSDEGYVFDGGNGQPLDPDALTHAFERARSRAGIEGVRLHDLRHGWATTAMGNGTNPRVISDVLGHANVAFTMMVYSHPNAEASRAAMAAVEVALGDALTEG